ncbi:hypothetical protein ACLOJK_008197 [Asimina triloba]
MADRVDYGILESLEIRFLVRLVPCFSFSACAASAMAKGGRHSRLLRRSSTSALVLFMLLMLSLVLLMLLALGILSLPISSRNDAPDAVDLNAVMKSATNAVTSTERSPSISSTFFEFRNLASFPGFLCKLDFFSFPEGREWEKEASSGLKFSPGNPEPSSITIS